MAIGNVDVIIPFLNPDQLLIDCICSLNKNDNVGMFYLVQNGVDGSRADEKKKKLIKLLEVIPKNENIKHLIVKRKNTSFAINHGIRESKNKYVMFASSHSYFEDGYVDQLYAEMKKNKNIYVIGGRVVCLPGSPDNIANAVRDAFSSYLCCFSKYRSLMKQGKYFHSVKIYGAIYKKSALEKINLFDEIKERAQDIDVVCRLVQSGGDAIIFPVKNVYWILTIKTPYDLYKRYFKQGYWSTKHNIGNRNYFIVLAFIFVFTLGIMVGGELIKNFIISIFICIVVYSFKISKRKANTLVVAASFFLAYAGYLLGIFKAIITVHRPDAKISLIILNVLIAGANGYIISHLYSVLSG